MCTTATTPEILLMGAVFGSVLVGGPLGLAFLARGEDRSRTAAAGVLLLAAGALVAAFALRGGAQPAFLDLLPLLAALLLAGSGALWLASLRLGGSVVRNGAFALTLAAAATGAAVLAVMLWPDPGACERLMRPPTPPPS